MPRTEQGIVSERVRSKVNMKFTYDERIKAGLCYRCGVPCDINPRTNKPYHQCMLHRLKEYKREKIRKGRNGGMADINVI